MTTTDSLEADRDTVHLFVDHDRNRELLAEWLADTYAVTAEPGEIPDGTDLCVVDERGFSHHRETLEDWKDDIEPVFAPVILVTDQVPGEDLDPEEWETIDGLYVIDEVVSVPVEKTVLYRRLENLLERRALSSELSTRYERSEERFSSLFHATPDPAFVVSEGELTYVNDALCEQAGVQRPALVGSPLGDLSVFDGESLRTIMSQVDAALTGESTGSETVSFQTDEGRRYFETNVNPMRLDDQVGAVVVLRDVTERSERERELRESEERFQQIAANVHELIWVVDVDSGTVEYVSPGYEEMLGEEFDATPNRQPSEYFDIVHPDDRASVEDTVGSMLEDARTGSTNDHYHFEFRVETDDRGVRWLEGDGYPIHDENGEVHRYVGVFEDFTEFKRRERRYRAIFDQTFQFTSLLEPDGTIIETNEAVLDFADLGRDSVVGNRMWEGPSWQDPEARARLRDAIEEAADGAFVRFEEQLAGHGGVATFDISIKPVTDEFGDVVLLVVEGRDITELKQRERALERQNERLEEFAGIVSHDLRNPLQVVSARLEHLKERGLDPEEQDHVAAMGRAVDRMDDLVDELLMLARQGETVSDSELVDLDRVAREAWGTVNAPDATLETDSSFRLEADESRLQQLFENLFRNSVDHVGEDVTVRVGRLDDGFYVEDDGPGIPEDDRDRVFEMGYSTQDNGTGFGLNIVADIAAAHDWDVTVTDGTDGGARFEITGLD